MTNLPWAPTQSCSGACSGSAQGPHHVWGCCWTSLAAPGSATHPWWIHPFAAPWKKETEEGSGWSWRRRRYQFYPPLHLLQRGAADPAHPVSSGQLCRLCAKSLNRAWAECWAWVFVQPGAPLRPSKCQAPAAGEAAQGEKIKFSRKNIKTAGKVKVTMENMKHQYH